MAQIFWTTLMFRLNGSRPKFFWLSWRSLKGCQCILTLFIKFIRCELVIFFSLSIFFFFRLFFFHYLVSLCLLYQIELCHCFIPTHCRLSDLPRFNTKSVLLFVNVFLDCFSEVGARVIQP